MMIRQIYDNKTDYMNLLLLADEQESMIMRYLDKGDMYILEDNGIVCAECVVTDEGESVCELKNIAVLPASQKKGYGRKLIDFIVEHYSRRFTKIIVGTGDSPLTVPFYEKCGFVQTHRIKNFFVDNYDHPIFEAGTQLVDMVYLEKKL